MKKTVVLLGASQKKDRYSNKALNMLKEYNHTVIPIHPQLKEIDGVAVRASLQDVKEDVDTITLYISPQRGEALLEDILRLGPHRVIFNPGTESEIMKKRLLAAGIESINACTLVLLRTGQF